ncbi:hypothetical protein B0H13DRAFT_1980022, partial [Mycena leptocephala]
ESPFATLGLEENHHSGGEELKTVHALAKDKFSWETIVPSAELLWTDCYSENQCARLKVPLDYSRPDGASAAIAMLRMHSGVPHDSPAYRGPGESGVDLVAVRGAQLSTVVGPEYDVIGFDPRDLVWSSGSNTPSMNSSADALAQALARGMLEGQLAGERDDGSLRFITTDHTARDMLRIVQAHGLEKIQYWGFSYGSVLGATFASMFPENVGRLVIDGVVDSENYFATEWSNNLIDTDKVWMAFIDGCVAAGPEGCGQIYASLRARPIPVRTNTSFGVVDYSMLRPLADLSAGNGTACACDPSEYRFESVQDAGAAKLSKLSGWADMWERVRMPCLAWPDFPKNHFQGASYLVVFPFYTSPKIRPIVANTSFPVLLVGNTADPVTPLWAYVASAELSEFLTRCPGFAGSVVLPKIHRALLPLGSLSLYAKYVRQYFLNGTLPEPGTVCPVIAPPFPEIISTRPRTHRPSSAFRGRSYPLGGCARAGETFDVRFPAGL